MYAVVTTGGKQYRVEPGSELTIERVPGDPGAPITFDRVLLLGDGEAVTVGTPTVEGASVSGTVLREERGPKLIIFKFKQKVKYRRTTGHRQRLTRVRIDEISAGGKQKRSATSETARPDAESKPKAAAKRAAKADSATEDKPKASRSRKAATKTETTEAPSPRPATRRRTTAKKASSEKEGEE